MNHFKKIFEELIIPLSKKHKTEIQEKLKLSNYEKWDSNWHDVVDSECIFKLEGDFQSLLSDRNMNTLKEPLESDTINIMAKIIEYQKNAPKQNSADINSDVVSEHVYEM